MTRSCDKCRYFIDGIGWWDICGESGKCIRDAEKLAKTCPVYDQVVFDEYNEDGSIKE